MKLPDGQLCYEGNLSSKTRQRLVVLDDSNTSRSARKHCASQK